MTFREKLQPQHPMCCGPNYNGGCRGCPDSYGYEVDSEGPCDLQPTCTACWDRESPDTKPKEPPVDRAKLLIALECCRQPKVECNRGCPYRGNGNCLQTLAHDSLAYISYLEEAAGIG